MSVRKVVTRPITLTTGGTPVNILVGTANEPNSLAPRYRVTGTQTLSVGNFTIVPSGTPYTDETVEILWEASATLSGNSIAVFGVTIPAGWETLNWASKHVYNGSAWITYLTPDFETTAFVLTDDIADLAITTGKIAALAVTTAKLEAGGAGVGVTNAKMAEMPTVTVKGNDSAGPAVPQDLTMTELRTILAQSITASGGDVTCANTAETPGTGVTTLNLQIAAGAVGATELATDAVTNAKMADDSVTLTNLASTGELESLTTSSPTPNSTALTVLASLAIPTGAMDTAGDVLEITAYGTTGATANNKTLTLVLGTTVLATNSTTAAPNNLNWTIEAKIFYTGAAAQKGYCKFTFNGVASEIDVFTGTETWLANTVYIKGQNGTAAVGEITLEGFQAINHKKNNN